MTDWIQDWFGSEYYSLLYKHRDCDEAQLFLDNLILQLKLSPENKIIDCGCGKGRHSVYLAEKGYDVTGIDISEKNIEEAKKNERKNLAFYVHDKRNLFRVNYFDVALSLFTSFGYFEKDSENNKCIRSMASSLKSGGWVVLDFMNITREIKNLVPEEQLSCNEITFSVKRFIENDHIVKEIQVTDKGKTCSYRERVKAYKQSDLENFFTQNELEVVHLFGNYNLDPFDEIASERLILIGKK